MNTIITKTLQNELQYNNTTVLTYKIEFPELHGFPSINTFNSYNKKIAIELENYCKTDLFKQAKDLYDYNLSNGYPIMVFEVVLSFYITFNANNLVSLYSDQYMFTGGAHGSTIRSSQTWDLKKYKMLPLSYFFYDDPYFLLDILRKINKDVLEQTKNEENQYFDNYCELIINTFNPDNYYLEPDYIVIYFQQYDIAPYSSGIPTFKV